VISLTDVAHGEERQRVARRAARIGPVGVLAPLEDVGRVRVGELLEGGALAPLEDERLDRRRGREQVPHGRLVRELRDGEQVGRALERVLRRGVGADRAEGGRARDPVGVQELLAGLGELGRHDEQRRLDAQRLAVGAVEALHRGVGRVVVGGVQREGGRVEVRVGAQGRIVHVHRVRGVEERLPVVAERARGRAGLHDCGNEISGPQRCLHAHHAHQRSVGAVEIVFDLVAIDLEGELVVVVRERVPAKRSVLRDALGVGQPFLEARDLVEQRVRERLARAGHFGGDSRVPGLGRGETGLEALVEREEHRRQRGGGDLHLSVLCSGRTHPCRARP
jgi:hypothetical protein